MGAEGSAGVLGVKAEAWEDVAVLAGCAHCKMFACPASSFEAVLLIRVSRRLLGLCCFGLGLRLAWGSRASDPHVFFCSSYRAICSGVTIGRGSGTLVGSIV